MNEHEKLRARRDQAIDALSDAFATDTIDVAEFERRLAVAHRAEDEGALSQVTQDLPKRTLGPVAETAPAAVAATAARALPARIENDRVKVLLGSVTRAGHWSPPASLQAKVVLGSLVLDFRDAQLAPGVTEIVVDARLGAVEIIVPAHLPVEISGNALLGSFDQVARVSAHPDPTAPMLRIRGSAVLGSVEVITKAARSRA